MSAYGAYGYAKHGKSYRFILGHYYTRDDASGRWTKPRVVRVLLDISPGDVEFSGATSACGAAARPRRAATRPTASAARSSCAAPAANRSPTAGASCAPPGAGKIAIAGHGTYRGALETVPTESDAGSLNVVNALALEQYVKGVMPNEVPPSWPTEELKAQAVAVRSIALTGDVGGNGFDLYADTRSQVYEGLESEYASTNAAVAATRGQVVMYGGEVAQTLYSACSGGHTESVRQRLRLPRPLPGRRPRPLRLLLPAAQMDARTSAARKSAPASAPTCRGS